MIDEPKNVGAIVEDSGGDLWKRNSEGTWDCTAVELVSHLYRGWRWEKLSTAYRLVLISEGEPAAKDTFTAEEILELIKNVTVTAAQLRELREKLGIKPKKKTIVLTVELPYDGDCEPGDDAWCAGAQTLMGKTLSEIRDGVKSAEIREEEV